MEPSGNEGMDHVDGGAPADWVGPQSMALTELAEMDSGQQGGANPLDVELQGDAVPEQFRGKKVTDVLGVVDGLRNALKLSEEARTQALATMQALAERGPAPAQAPAPAAPAEPVEMSAEQLRELYGTDPFAATQKMFESLERRLSKGIDSRVAPVTGAAAHTAEQMARQKHSEAFEVLGKEIDTFVSQAFPGGRNNEVLAQPGAWDRVVNYVRGENLEKILDHRTKKAQAASTQQRQEAERQAAGPTLTGGRQASPRQGGNGKMTPVTMDNTAKEIARKMMPDLPEQKAYEEYCKFYT